MVDLVLTDEQFRTVENVRGAIRLVTAEGRVLAILGSDSELNDQEIAEVIASLKRPVNKWYTTTEVLDHLARLTPQ